MIIKYIKITILLLAIMLSLCACQKAPGQEVVISKNDGSFDANIVQSATIFTQEEWQQVDYYEEFTSTDSSVLFTLDIHQELPQQNMPVLEVKPYFLTGEDAERVAKVLFGDAEFYEQRPVLADPEKVLTKNEVQQRLTKWSEYVNKDYILWLYGDEERAAFTIDLVKRFIENYNELYDFALDHDPRIPCQWTLKGEYIYIYPEEEIKTLSRSQLSEWNEGIQAEVYTDENTYTYTVSIRNEDDFKISNINAYFGGIMGAAGGTVEKRQFEAERCRTRPTEEQIDAIAENATNLLEKMRLGSWKVDECALEVSYYGDIPEYRVRVTAVPVLNGCEVFRRPQITNLRSSTAYASSYYLTDVEFIYCANGELLSFLMSSPVEVTNVVNENAATIPMDELILLAQKHLSLSDVSGYVLAEDVIDTYEQKVGEKIECSVHITQLDYGLTRVKVPDTDDMYYYVPGMMLSGSIEYRGEESGKVYDGLLYQTNGSTLYPLVCLNAIDGTVIELNNPL